MVIELKCTQLKMCQCQVAFMKQNIVLNFLHPNNWHTDIICIAICTQKYYQQHFQILLQIKVKEFFTINNYPFWSYQNSYNKTDVTASNSKDSAIYVYSISTVN